MRATLDSGCVAAAHVVAKTLVVQSVWRNLVICNFLTLVMSAAGCMEYGDVFFFFFVCCLFHIGLLWKPLEAPLDFSLDGSETLTLSLEPLPV